MLRLDNERLGQHSEARIQEVERGAIRKFAVALGLQDAVYHSVEAARAAGYRDLLAPPTFAVTLLPWTIPGVELPLAGVLHGEQEFEWLQPICAGDKIEVTGWVDEIKSRSGQSGQMTLITVASEGHGWGGALAFRSRALLIVTEEADGGDW